MGSKENLYFKHKIRKKSSRNIRKTDYTAEEEAERDERATPNWDNDTASDGSGGRLAEGAGGGGGRRGCDWDADAGSSSDEEEDSPESSACLRCRFGSGFNIN